MTHRRLLPWLLLFALVVAGCRSAASPSAVREQAPAPTVESVAANDPPPGEPLIVVAETVRSSVDEAVVREAYRRVVELGERDFGVRPERTINLYVDPDSALGLEEALGLSQKTAIHLRASYTRNLNTLLPLLLHEYTHVLQYQMSRLRPQWWVEGQADHAALRIRPPAEAERERRALYGRLAADVRANRAPALADLRSSIGWDAYIRRSGSGRAYGWGNAAVAFIEDQAGFAAVRRIFTDQDGPNTLSRFDDLVRELTGLGPTEFDAALKQWVTQQAKG